MSRIGKQPVIMPDGVSASLEAGVMTLTGPQGELSLRIPTTVEVKQDGQVLTVVRQGDEKQNRSDHGTIRALL
jgi:large subunit ribosomal protein L6